tara:strand:- start:219 stop:647 length:429 start_codon:yes stop_codon:yes gene_type:complete
MKLSFTAFILICLFSVSTASDLTDGATTGFIIGSIGRGFSSKSDEIHVIEYYNFTRDTSLQKFPPVYNSQHISEKIIIVDAHPTLKEKNIINIIFIFMLSSMIYMSCFVDKETRQWTSGYIFGRLMEMLFSIIICVLNDGIR